MYSFNPPLPSALNTPPKVKADTLWVKGNHSGLNNVANKGLGFSEFIELIGRIAIDGMEQDSYHALFPTPFSKLLAVLTVWGVADLRKVEEVRVLHGFKSI